MNEELKYQTTTISEEAFATTEICTVKLRYKRPKGSKSMEMIGVVHDNWKSFDSASKDFQLASCVGGFGMLLKDSQHKGRLSYAQLEVLATNIVDPNSIDEIEFLELIQRASALSTLNTLNQPL